MLKLNILKWGKIKSQDAQKILKNVGSTVVFPSKYVDKKYKVKEVDGQLKLVRSDWLGKLRNFFGKDTQQEAMNLTLNSARKLTKKEVKLTENNSKKRFPEEVKSFDKATLKKTPVFISNYNRALKSGDVFATHGFIVAGNPGEKGARTYGERKDVSRGEFEVTKKFYDGTFNKKYELDSKTILAISKLIGKKYEFMDKFIYELKGLVPELSDKKIESLLKVAKKINKMDGYYNSCYSNSEAELSDLAHFNEGKTRNQQQDVTVTSLQEVIREKQLYQRYVDEKLGLQGQTKTAYDPKDPEKKRARAKLKKRMVKHRLLPWGKFQSNCNKTSATIIQQAMNKDQQVSPKQHQLVKTSTGWSVGSGKRMYIHSSLPFFQSVIKNNPVSKTSNMEVNLE